MRAVVTTSPRRVVVLGVTGSGKTELARRLARRRGLRVVDRDAILWLPGWVKRSDAEQSALLDRAIAGEDWVLDGMRGAWTGRVLDRADLVVGLDYPRWVSLCRLLRRTVQRLVTRESFAGGNTESWRETVSRESILLWHARTFARERARIRRLAADPAAPPVVRLSSARETDAWLAGVVRDDGTAT